MTEDEQVEAVLAEWRSVSDWFVGSEIQDQQMAMARAAVRALAERCGETHPQRASIACILLASHLIAHRNDEHRVEWYDDGRTIHVDLGEVALLADPDYPVDEESLAPPAECEQPHPARASITCTSWEDHTPAGLHRSSAHGLTWTQDWTNHDGLGSVTLEPDDELEAAAAPAARDQANAAGPNLALALLEALRTARKALAAVDGKYRSDSQRITAPLVRQVRDASDQADEALTAMASIVGQAYVS